MLIRRISELNPDTNEVIRMRRFDKNIGWHGRGHRISMAILAGALVTGAMACDSLLEVDIPGQVEDSALDDIDDARVGLLRVSYTGRDDFLIALDLSAATVPVRSGGSITASSAKVTMRYYF